MNHIVAASLLLFVFTGVDVLAQDKRVLLHSDDDLYQVITSLQTDMAALNTSLQTEKALTSSLRTELASLQAKVATLETDSHQTQQTAGSVYIRWGRTSCPANGTEMVYKGRMAGSKWSETTGGANHICLPDDPTWGKYVDGVTGWGTIYGTEIGSPDSVANVLFGKPVQDQDVPCVMCSTTRPTNAMISGRATCYPGWTLEYQGYLISSNPQSHHNNADYVCLDRGLEFAPHGSSNDDDHIIDVVEVVCGKSGSLPCPPYVNGRELSCVLCSK